MIESDKKEDSRIQQWSPPKGDDVSQQDIMFKFDGAWLPSVDPALIGPINYQKLINMRYADGGIEGVNGYTEVNTTAITTYTNIKNGIHFIAPNRTQEDYVLVHATDGTGTGQQGTVQYNKTAIGSQGNFESTALWTDTSTDLVGRFSQAPSGHVAYANGEESFIWEGDEGFLSAAFTTTSQAEELPIDVTDKLINSRTDSDNSITLDATRSHLTLLTTRQASGFKVYVDSNNPNTVTAEVLLRYWSSLNKWLLMTTYDYTNGTVDGIYTGTQDGLSETGLVETGQNAGNSALKHFEDRYLYGYQLLLGYRLNTSSVWNWEESSTSGEWYLVGGTNGVNPGGDPAIAEPAYLSVGGANYTKNSGGIGGLGASEWGWGDNETPALGYNTIYVKSGGDFDIQQTDVVASGITGTDATITQVTAKMPAAKPSNIWDGVYRTPIQCQVKRAAANTFEDYTLHVAESSSVSVPVGAVLDAVDTDGEIIIMFDERMAGIRFTMLGDFINDAGGSVTVKYWDGSAYTTVGTSLSDGTSADVGTLEQSGLMSWIPPSDEEKKTLFGTQGYAYQLTFSVKIADTAAGTADEDVVVDLITGVPAQKSVETYAFPLKYKNKLFMCGYKEGNEGNRIDYSDDNQPDVFNGENSSLDGFQSIYVGGSENLTGGVQLYNRFGSNLFASLALFKENELYLLTGDSPLDYKLYPVSQSIGCPAPLTIATAEVGFEMGEQVARNVVMFVSNSGPMLYDGATLQELEGLDTFFDPAESVSVDFDYLDRARGWFDSTYKEYNILLPIGGTQPTLNYWLCYDIVRKKWFQKDTGSGNKVQCGFQVIDNNGDLHLYGGSTVGKMYQLENGTSWAGSNIENEIQTGDFFPSGNEWDITRIRRLKFAAKRISEDANVFFYYYGNTDFDGGVNVDFTNVTTTMANSGSAGVSFTDVTAAMANSGSAGVQWNSSPDSLLNLNLDEGLNRLARTTVQLNKTNWCHSFGFKFSSKSTSKGLQPVMWGVQWEFVRKDENDLS